MNQYTLRKKIYCSRMYRNLEEQGISTETPFESKFTALEKKVLLYAFISTC